MRGLKQLIEKHLEYFPEFGYYLTTIDGAIEFEETRPDTSIEHINSLFQGFSKTIILALDETATREELDVASQSSDKLVKRAAILLKENDDVIENDFCTRAASLANMVAGLRNKRGDVSHGKAVPKILSSNTDLARMANETCAPVLRYMLANLFRIKLELAKQDGIETPINPYDMPLEYDDYPDFNDYLDEQFPLDGSKVIYSQVLFDSYPEDYRIQLEEYIEEQEELAREE